jgi:hypothetical protein
MRILAEEGPSELVGQFRIVVGPQNHRGFETQGGIGERFYHYTLRTITESGGSGKNGYSDILGYQVNSLLSGNNVVCVFRTDSPTLRRVDDCVMNKGMNSARQQNPFVVCQILEMYVFVSGSRMGHWQDRVERRHGEWRRSYLRVLWWCCHESEIQVACQDTPEQLA